MPFYAVVILFAVGVMLAVGDIFMKLWVSKNGGNLTTNIWWYIGGMLLYIISLSLYAYMLKKVDFAAASYAILLFNMIVIAIAGYFYLGDNLSMLELGGIICGIASVTLFALSNS